MIHHFSKEKPLQDFLHAVKENPSVLVEELWSAPKALLLALLHKELKKTLLVVSNRLSSSMAVDLAFFGMQSLEFPNWETLPSEEIPPSLDIVGKRYEVLHALATHHQPLIVFTTLQGLLQKVMSKKSFKNRAEEWRIKTIVPFQSLCQKLEALGYKKAAVVSDKGEYALRGGICDLFPSTATSPIRIDFFGDEIETLRTFDPVSQKSIEKISSFLLTPATEIDQLQKEQHLNLLLDYLEKDSLIVFDELEPVEEHYVQIQSLPGSKSRTFASFQEIVHELKGHKLLFFPEKPITELSSKPIHKPREERICFDWCDASFEAKRWFHPFLSISTAFGDVDHPETLAGILQGLETFCQKKKEALFLYSSEAQLATIQEKLKSFQFPKESLTFTKGYLSKGFITKGSSLALIPFTEFSHRPLIRRQKWRLSTHTPASEFHELLPGDIVVHFNHGIAKFLGIEKKPNHQGALTEFLVLEYAEKSTLFVPISQAHLVSRYIGAKEETPIFSTLGTNKWQKTKMQAQASIVGYAEQMLRYQAERNLKGGFIYPSDSEAIVQFEEDFPFPPTEDQLRAIYEFKGDMCSTKAMDRLICGDVGYGKTEVAMRAAFKAVVDGKKQVAVLVPTTVLAMQHFDNFCERMANFPVKIACLSRFIAAKETKKILKDTQEGNIDILIGTHRLLSADIAFKDLGLIIVDEEQRFGVRAKEKLKQFKIGVDCLTLSATPIPRTLYMTIVGAKDISVINTPPQDRLPIKTILAERDEELIKNALLRELSRDGQAFFIHNRVESIYAVKELIEKLIPKARVEVAHGQMDTDALDRIFHAYKEQKIDILVATSIVENGIDIPNANTILIDRSDQFGLADLYQLRGRVGRWNRPAYAYFLVAKGKALSEIAGRRLNAMLTTSGFGGGLKLAMRDLEIRGAGDILGVQQSGHVSQIGFHLYCKMLKKTIEALRHKKAPSFIETKMEFHYSASLSEDYVNETSLRMELYHRLGEASSLEEVDSIFEGIKDRFGPLPEPALWLKHLSRIRVFATLNAIVSLKFETLTFTAEKLKDKEQTKKIFALPRHLTPELLEKEVIASLKKFY